MLSYFFIGDGAVRLIVFVFLRFRFGDIRDFAAGDSQDIETDIDKNRGSGFLYHFSLQNGAVVKR